ncbi:MAG: DsrE family protein [Planctomycetota bacterium]|nr:DsrE family protein [Planctomycetota bacterium]
MKTVIVVNHDGMGHGDAELGRKILRTFFTKAPQFKDIEAIVFYNSGVRCLAKGSDYQQPLSTLFEDGVDLIACGTCVDKFELREKMAFGEIGSMDQILKELEAAAKVITL